MASCTTSRLCRTQAWPACRVQLSSTVWSLSSAGSKSSRNSAADFPPSSNSVRFIVWRAAAPTWRAVAALPTKVTMSTRGSVVRTSAASCELVDTTLTTPAGMSVSSSRPGRGAGQRAGSRRRLQDNAVSRCDRRGDLLQVDRVWEVPRGDRRRPRRRGARMPWQLIPQSGLPRSSSASAARCSPRRSWPGNSLRRSAAPLVRGHPPLDGGQAGEVVGMTVQAHRRVA